MVIRERQQVQILSDSWMPEQHNFKTVILDCIDSPILELVVLEGAAAHAVVGVAKTVGSSDRICSLLLLQ
jgi:hypothetical protein